MERFICTHCGHPFETESAETVVCPNCFWSTSVKKDETANPTPTPTENQTRLSSPERVAAPERLWLWSGGTLFTLLLVGVSIFAFRHLKKQDEILQKIETKNAQLIAREAPELILLPEEREILNRQIPLARPMALTPKEKGLLAPRLFFRPWLTAGLPTPPWEEKQFEEFLKSQELQYRLPLPRTYRRKLKQLFKKHSLPAAQAFEAKDFLKARDEWIRSLTFPIYQNDVQKHRGVVLTILRPYVNDTLSKIGAMNTSLLEKELYAQEEKIKTTYDHFQFLLEKESWEEANALLLELAGELEKMKGWPEAVSLPPLPQEISEVDSDIREVLLVQALPRPPSLPDGESLRQDLARKEKVIQSHLVPTLEAVWKQYEQALLLIQNKNWREAKAELEKIDFPEELREDAQAKIKLLNKLLSPSLDSQEKTG